jgi:peptidoglycan hydrolase-like protein with peptidoglycan-binding domain
MMKIKVLLIAILAVLSLARAGLAQEQAWLQIESQPSLTMAEERVRAYAAVFPDVAGFQVRNGWYVVVLGPYAPEAAAGRIADLKRENLIPRDSFITDGATHALQFWPVGQSAVPAAEPVTETPLVDVPGLEVPGVEVPGIEVPEALADETPQQAKASEAELSRDGRKALQQAMAWYGFYTAAIDGSFGAGTRKSMAAWQEANGFDATGVLTSLQRATLIANFDADQAEFGFQTITEAEAGIEITLPTKLVQFDHYEPPFVHFAERDGSGLRVILISEPGDQNSLYGLYDILQTLEVVPAQGERSRNERDFTINAVSDTVQSFAYAEASKGMVKGYLVVWNPADAERMQRILPAMAASFRSVGDKALDPGLVPMDEAARSGLLSGLEVKTAKLSRSGFFVDAKGTVVTTTEAVAQCGRVTIENDTDATVTATDAALGLAILTPSTPMAPAAFAAFDTGAVRKGAEIAVAGYSYEARLPAPVLTFGTLEDDKGLNGEAGVLRLAIPVLPGDAGGPVVDASGAVVGMLLPGAANGAKLLPDGVAFAATAQALTQALAAAGVVTSAPSTTGLATPDALNAQALGMTVLVSCWE